MIYTAGINYWLKSQLLAVTEPGDWPAFWLGAKTTGRHDEHQPGTWNWQHMNETVTWSVHIFNRLISLLNIFFLHRFDWGENEPNNWGHDQMCLTLQEFHNPLWPIVRHIAAN